VLAGALDAQQQRAEAGDHRDTARQVQAAQAGVLALAPGQGDERGDERDDPDGHVDPEDGLPAHQGGEGPAEEDAGGDAGAPDGCPQRETTRSLAARVGGRDQGHGGRGQQRGAQPLGRAGGHQHRRTSGGSRHEGRGREQRQPGHEDPPAREQVGDAPTQQQPTARHQQVCSDQPLQVVAAQSEAAPDRGQSGVDDGDVQDDEDLGDQGDDQDGPRATLLVMVRRGAGGGVVARSPVGLVDAHGVLPE
jgi:hypothetical protein